MKWKKERRIRHREENKQKKDSVLYRVSLQNWKIFCSLKRRAGQKIVEKKNLVGN